LIRYECDKCGKALTANDSDRYVVKIEIYAAAGPVELDLEPQADPGAELSKVLASLSDIHPDELEDKTYRLFRFDVCDRCRRELLKRPLGTQTAERPSR